LKKALNSDEEATRQEFRGEKGKGRDIGYALVVSSCEEA